MERKDLENCLKTLRNIENLKDNWNQHQANAFSSELIKKCQLFLKELTVSPFIAPTACNSIQFEWEKENGDYFEFQIFEDKIEVFMLTRNDGEKEFLLEKKQNPNQLLKEFFEEK